MAPPIMLGATVHEAPALLKQGATLGGAAVLSGVVAAVVAYLATAFLMRYFGRHDFAALDPFAYYCVAAGAVTLGLIRYVL